MSEDEQNTHLFGYPLVLKTPYGDAEVVWVKRHGEYLITPGPTLASLKKLLAEAQSSPIG